MISSRAFSLGIGIFSNHFEPGPSRNRAIAALGAGQAIGYIVGLIGGEFRSLVPSWIPRTDPFWLKFVHSPAGPF